MPLSVISFGSPAWMHFMDTFTEILTHAQTVCSKLFFLREREPGVEALYIQKCHQVFRESRVSMCLFIHCPTTALGIPCGNHGKLPSVCALVLHLHKARAGYQ